MPDFCVAAKQVTVNFTVCSDVPYPATAAAAASWSLDANLQDSADVICTGPTQVVGPDSDSKSTGGVAA
jgi:hypothetical protein